MNITTLLCPKNAQTFKKTVRAVAKHVTQPRISKLMNDGVDAQQATEIAGRIDKILAGTRATDAIFALLFVLDMAATDLRSECISSLQ